MMSFVKRIALPLAMVGLSFAPLAARADNKHSPFSGIPISGDVKDKATNQKIGSFSGTMDIVGFVAASDRLYPVHAIGIVNGTAQVGGSIQQVANAVVETPLTNFPPPAESSAVGFGGRALSAPVSAAQTAGSCQILHLVLGPLHLDLLGLVVDLNEVHLDVAAQPGSGNLLGNLLCAVTNLLNGVNLGTALTNVVNSLITLLNNLIAAL